MGKLTCLSIFSDTCSDHLSMYLSADDITVTTGSDSAAAPRVHRRHSSFDEQTMRNLEKQLALRPDKQELVDRNILKGSFLACWMHLVLS